MKKLIQKIKKRPDWTLIIIGTYMAVHGIFSFSVLENSGDFGTDKVYSYGYSYRGITEIEIALGAAFLVLGILMYKKGSKSV